MRAPHGLLVGFARVLALALVGGLATGCPPQGDAVPLDSPVFPTGLAIHPDPDAERLVVVSSNFSREFDEGAVLVADLGVARAAAGDPATVVETAYLKGGTARVPSHGDKPVFSPSGRLFLASKGARIRDNEERDANIVSSIDVDPETGASCDGSDLCGVPPRALQLPLNDPFDIVITSDDDGVVRGIVTMLSSSTVFFFRDDPGRAGAARMQITDTRVLDESIGSVRSAVLRGARANGSAAHVIATAELSRQLLLTGALIVVFEPDPDADVFVFDVTAETGALSIRDVILLPGDDGAEDALVVALRQPDAIARFEIDDDSGIPAPRLSALAETCRTPSSLAYAALVERVLLTCQDGDTVVALDPITLETTDAVRFFGRAPYDIVTHPTEPEAYVSFFLDNSVGILDLLDDDNKPRLTAVGRIGRQLPPPEDGRQ